LISFWKAEALFAISDFANYKRPEARVFFVTNTSFFSDGSIFQHCSNACGYIQSSTPPEDIAAMVEHYAHGRGSFSNIDSLSA
jgi:hypothetical protein